MPTPAGGTPPHSPPLNPTIRSSHLEAPHTPPRLYGHGAAPQVFQDRTPIRPKGIGGDPRKEARRAGALDTEMNHDYCPIHVTELLKLSKPANCNSLTQKEVDEIGGFDKVDISVEQKVYEPMCDAVNHMFKLKKLPYVLKNTSATPQDGEELLKPDLCLYHTGVSDEAAYSYNLKQKKNPAGEPLPRGNAGRTAWAWIIAPVEVKVDDRYAPFETDDPKIVCEKLTDDGQQTRAQIISYATRIHRHQPRTFIPMVLIHKDSARLLRWDQAGVIVSNSFNYKIWPKPLLNFFYYLAAGGPTTQGYDPTVSFATEAQLQKLRSYTPHSAYSSEVHDTLLNMKSNIIGESKRDRIFCPVRSVTCRDVSYRQSSLPETQRTYAYLIGPYRSATRAPTGRGTKAYIAYDVDHDQLVFLKDYWVPSMTPGRALPRELDTYAAFREQNVRFVPTALAGGAEDSQKTLSQTYSLKLNDSCPEERSLYRVVLQDIGRSLWSFNDSRELVSTVNDALTAHYDAFCKASYLHRDVSADNIMINIMTGKGLLVDWDLARRRESLTNKATQSARSGTWFYMSGLLSYFPRKPSTLSDDLESFLWSTVLPALRFLCHTRTATLDYNPSSRMVKVDYDQPSYHLGPYIEQLFYYSGEIGGYIVGGNPKAAALMEPRFNVISFTNPQSALQTLLDRLFPLFREFYRSLNEQDLERRWGTPGPRQAAFTKDMKSDGRSPSNVLDDHSRVREVFQRILSDGSLEWSEQKTEDQFLELWPDKDIFPVCDTKTFNRKRPPPEQPQYLKDLKKLRATEAREAGYNSQLGEEYDEDIFGVPRVVPNR